VTECQGYCITRKKRATFSRFRRSRVNISFNISRYLRRKWDQMFSEPGRFVFKPNLNRKRRQLSKRLRENRPENGWGNESLSRRYGQRRSDVFRFSRFY